MGRPRFELGTSRLKAECSTAELASRCALKNSDFPSIAQPYELSQINSKSGIWHQKSLERSMSPLAIHGVDRC